MGGGLQSSRPQFAIAGGEIGLMVVGDPFSRPAASVTHYCYGSPILERKRSVVWLGDGMTLQEKRTGAFRCMLEVSLGGGRGDKFVWSVQA